MPVFISSARRISGRLGARDGNAFLELLEGGR
jgi:hypothetical protein